MIMPHNGFHLEINNAQTTDSIKGEFNKLFPFLKIEFYKEPHMGGQTKSKSKMITSDVKLKEIQKIKTRGNIEGNGQMSVEELEQKFKNEFGLYIEVFRKSGSIWLETSATDSWTLAQQNEEGKLLDLHFKTEKENNNDSRKTV
jgi:hypothetical protein